MEEHEKRFPDCFPEDFEEKYLPSGLSGSDLTVFRVCTNGTINKATFRSSWEDSFYGDRPSPSRWRKKRYRPGDFSVSCNDTKEGADQALKCLVGHYPEAFLISGPMSFRYGPFQRTVEREPDYKEKSHFDWWIYADADPSDEFKPVMAEPPDGDERQKESAAKED